MTLISSENQNFPAHFGEKIFSWEAFDYHPYERGRIWYSIFFAFFAACILGILWLDPEWGWVSALCFLLVATIYFLVHKNGPNIHEIHVHENRLVIGKKEFNWDHFEGYFFLEDAGGRMIVFEVLEKFRKDRVKILMGAYQREHFKAVFEIVNLKELNDRKEGLLDLWTRVFKL